MHKQLPLIFFHLSKFVGVPTSDNHSTNLALLPPICKLALVALWLQVFSYSPWTWYIYLHELVGFLYGKFVGKYTIDMDPMSLSLDGQLELKIQPP